MQTDLYLNPHLAAFVADEVRAPIRPRGARATYSIYVDGGAHLDIHRDVRGCDVALVTCLEDSEPTADGGAIDVWHADLVTPLDAVRSHPSGYHRYMLREGETMVMHGGVLPHRVVPVRRGRLRVVSLMCFEIVHA